jgi:hypothetical protein
MCECIIVRKVIQIALLDFFFQFSNEIYFKDFIRFRSSFLGL